MRIDMLDPLSRYTALSALTLLAACSSAPPPAAEKSTPKITMNKESWGAAGGRPVDLYTLGNARGMQAKVSTYGAILVSVVAPDRRGQLADVLLGHDTLAGYLGTHPYMGAVVGRYGNRIGKGRFRLNGVEHKLAVNNGANHLHGGINGFDKAVWTAVDEGPQSVALRHVSPDGDEGYPGELDVTVTYTLTDDNDLRIAYVMKATGKDTVANITNHAYFNLTGKGEGEIVDHEIRIDADRFTPVDGGLIPTGELKSVEGTPFDFRKFVRIGERIAAEDDQIRFGKGYDHNFVLNGTPGTLRSTIRVKEPVSGRTLEVLTTEPGVQFYTGNFLDGSVVGKGGKKYLFRNGFCLETQHFPDSPNKKQFPTTTIKAGESRLSTTVFRFAAE